MKQETQNACNPSIYVYTSDSEKDTLKIATENGKVNFISIYSDFD